MKHQFFSIVTNDVKNLSKFYKTILQAEMNGVVDLENYVELNIDDFVVCVESIKSVEKRSGASFSAGSVFVEFEVNEVDEECVRLKELGLKILQEPFDNPWETRNFYFNDPEGNLICFYMNIHK
jgi:predicted enzyme related to lactoylglutathione lyase